MSKNLEKRLKVLEMKDGKITISEPFFTPQEEAAFREVAAQAITKNLFEFEAKKQPSALEFAEAKAQVREALKNQPCGGE
jgi:hypothetical protein